MSKEKYTALLLQLRPLLQNQGEALSHISTLRRALDFLNCPSPSPESTPENPYTKGFSVGFSSVESARLSHYKSLGPELFVQAQSLFTEAKRPVSPTPAPRFPEKNPKKDMFYTELKKVHNFIGTMGFTTGKTTMNMSLEVFHDFLRVKKFNVLIGNGFDQKVYTYAVTQGEKAAMAVNADFLKTVPSNDLLRLSPTPPLLERNKTPEWNEPEPKPVQLPAPRGVRHPELDQPAVPIPQAQSLFAHCPPFVTDTPFEHSAESSPFSLYSNVPHQPVLDVQLLPPPHPFLLPQNYLNMFPQPLMNSPMALNNANN